MLSPNEKIQRSFYALQKRLNDINVETLGTKSSNTFLIDLIKDKYKNKSLTIKDYREISIYVNFPGEEIPTPNMGTNNNQTSNNVLHLYDILPITARVKFSDNVKTGNIFLYKIKQPDGSFHVLIMEFLSVISKATRVGVVVQDWVVAPITDHALTQLPEFQTILNQYKNNDLW
ncbi:MAG: hypothetical protein AB7V16_07290 [Vulcanibacillus sp.]